MIIAIFLGLFYSWKLGLVCTIFFPLLILAVLMEMRITMGVDTVEKKAFEDSSKLAIEAITNIRTVAGELKIQYLIIQLLPQTLIYVFNSFVQCISNNLDLNS